MSPCRCLLILVAYFVAVGGPLATNVRAESEKPEPRTWTQQVDQGFGAYVVEPLESVIFFDFFSGPRENAAGEVTRQGWLKTPANPDGISVPFVVLWLLFGAMFLTVRMGFINLRAPRHSISLIRGKYDHPDAPGDVTHFQSLAAALSATVGLGNIAGVAIAIGTGGPGACFWLIVVGLLGMTSKFAECSLGQIYRTKDSAGKMMGGPMRYLRVGLAEMGLGGLGNVLAVLFALLCIGASFGSGNAFQVGQSMSAIRQDVAFIDEKPWLYGLIMAAAVGIVIVGGIKSIGAVAGRIVPVMCALYIAASLFILAIHYSELPTAMWLIVTSAFNADAVYGGFLGVMVTGIQRGAFGNEAGVGSAAIAHSAAKTDEPISEGIVALLEPFIDTVVVCTITAMVVIVTGAYNAPETVEAVAGNQGAAITLHAFVNGGFDWFRYLLYFALVLFAFSSCISWSYYGERCWVNLFGAKTSLIYKLLFLVFTFLGSVVTRGQILHFSDLMILGMSFPNLLGVFLMSGMIKRRLDEYWDKYRSGELKTAE